MSESVKEDLVIGITIIVVALIIILGIAIPCLIGQKRNIEREIKLKELEVYGEYRVEVE